MRRAISAFHSGDLTRADQFLSELTEKESSDTNVLIANQAMVALLQGDLRRAENSLRETRDRFDHFSKSDFGEKAISLVTDDRRIAYGGAVYERVLVRNMLALTSLLGDGRDAMAYCNQAKQLQKQLASSTTIAPQEDSQAVQAAAIAPDPEQEDSQRVALTDYLEGVIQEASHFRYDRARRAYAAVAATNPGFKAGWDDLMRARSGSHSQKGNGAVYIFAFLGAGPYKEEITAPATSHSLALATQMLHVMGNTDVPILSAPVKVARTVVPTPMVDNVQVSSNGVFLGVTQTITDVGELAMSEWLETRDLALARAIVRRVAKKSAIYKVKGQVDSDNFWPSIALDATGFLWEIAESADTRCWSTLPCLIQVVRCEMSEGVHRLAVQPAMQQAVVGSSHEFDVCVQDGKNTYVLAFFPARDLVGRIVISANGRLPYVHASDEPEPIARLPRRIEE